MTYETLVAFFRSDASHAREGRNLEKKRGVYVRKRNEKAH